MDFGKVPKIENGEIIKNSNGKNVYENRTKEEIEKFKIYFLRKLEDFKLIPNIIVETKNGFHVYWLLDTGKPQNIDAFTPLQEKLIKYFATFEERKEHADTSVKDISRVLRLINYNHLKNPKDPFAIKCIYLNTDVKYAQEDIASAIGCNIIELVSNAKSNEIKTIAVKADIINSPKESYKNYSSVLQYEDLIPFLKQQDLISYLGIDSRPNVNFKCIFHNDKKPSATIRSNGGYYKYFCNSPICTCYNNGKGMDIIDIVKIEENCDTSTAIKRLIEYFNIELKDLTWINKHGKRLENNITLLNQVMEKKDEFPYLNRIMKFGHLILTHILEISKSNISNRFFSINGESLFFFSNRYLSKEMKKDTPNINKYINLFCTLDLLRKIPYKDVNQNLRQTALQISQEKSHNGISFYTVPDYNKVLKTANTRAQIMLEYHFSIKGMSKKYLENCFGEEFADKIYLVNVKDSKKSKNICNAIENYILNEIKTYGYCTKDMLMSCKLKVDNCYIKNGVKEYEFRRVLPDIMQKYDLVYKKANKNINKALGINTKKYLIIKRSILDE